MWTGQTLHYRTHTEETGYSPDSNPGDLPSPAGALLGTVAVVLPGASGPAVGSVPHFPRAMEKQWSLQGK